MNINRARRLISEIEGLMCSGSGWDIFWRNALNEIRAGDVDGPFHEALVKIDALGTLDADLDEFINDFIREQIKRFYKQLYRTRRWHLINGHVYTYSDVLGFVKESQELIRLLRQKIEEIYLPAAQTLPPKARPTQPQVQKVKEKTRPALLKAPKVAKKARPTQPRPRPAPRQAPRVKLRSRRAEQKAQKLELAARLLSQLTESLRS